MISVLTGLVLACPGGAWHGAAGRGVARQGVSWRGEAGVTNDLPGHGLAGPGDAVLGKVRPGTARQCKAGTTRSLAAGHGRARLRATRQALAWRRWAWLGMEQLDRPGLGTACLAGAGPVQARQGWARQGSSAGDEIAQGRAGHGSACPGMARRRSARPGVSGHGRAGTPTFARGLAGHGSAPQGLARLGAAGRGAVWPGKAGTP